MIIHALAAACFSFYMVNIVRWQLWIKALILALWVKFDHNRRIKPFDCTVCLSAWSGLLIGLLMGYGWQAVEVMFIAGVMGVVIDAGVKRYL